MKHFLITRFNIKSEQWTQTKSGHQIIKETWLKERFNLFETYCLPSVMNQTNQNFYWCIFFDTETPVYFKDKIQKIASQYNTMHILFVDGFGTFQSTLSDFILSKLEENDEYIITTRLDNDDLIHKDFIATIKSLSVQQNNIVIDLIRGYQITINESKLDIRDFSTRYNPFISLVESREHFQTVISKNHEHWEHKAKTISYNSKPLWIQLVHQDNIFNDKILALKKVSHINNEDFGLEKKQFSIDNKFTSFYNFKMLPYRIYYYSKVFLKKSFFKKKT